ncbi:transmembrane 9 superfamily member 12-like [Rutidosis leptorrhynchoides]|uniref:transmembrane 9 superfamily member 12-like n=1 Tax=Rutidosis leptorrhynchoides TaxID=125765 RepID=UPI003A9A3DCD
MAFSSMKTGASYCLIITYVICVLHVCNAVDLSGSYMHTYVTGDELYAKVNSLTSIKTQIPFSYYSLPYCIPSMGIRKSEENIGQQLMGDQIYNSPYRFRMNVNESVFMCTTHPLNKHEVKLLTQRTRDMYQVNMLLDNLPVMNGFKIKWTGFPVGLSLTNNDDYYVINHLKFKVYIHESDEAIGVHKRGDDVSKAYGYEIVGFEVSPCSVKYESEKLSKLHLYDPAPSVDCLFDLKKSQVIREQERISFTYEVEFVKSDIKWPSRWDAYIKIDDANHWFYIFNSLMVIFFLAGVIFVILLRTVRRDLARYEELDQAQTNEEPSGWKLVVGDVFREPNNSRFLCVLIGNGVQITGLAIFTVILSALGYMSSRGTLLTGMIILYLLMGAAAGFAGAYLYRIVTGSSEGWRSLCWSIACFFPGVVFVIFTGLNFILWGSKSSGAISISLYFTLLSLWFFVSVPLILLGGYLGTRTETITYPVSTNQIARVIPARKYPSWILILAAGVLPFGALFIELFFILSGVYFGRYYTAFEFLLVVMLFLVIVCAEVSIVLTYMNLRVEDWEWWWKAFYASGSVSVYVFLYSVYFLVVKLVRLNGLVSVVIYLGYSLIIAVAIMLSAGTIGFIASFYFVYYLFSSVKFD